MARFFDVFVRIVLVFTAAPLTEQGWGERAIAHMWGGCQQLDAFVLSPDLSFWGFLTALLRAFVYVFLVLLGVIFFSPL